MNTQKVLLLLLFSILAACKNDDDNNNNTTSRDIPTVIDPVTGTNTTKNQINAFIYRTLNATYLYKDEQPLLANDRFTDVQLIDYINSKNGPEDFFEELTVERDRFSFISDNFEELENSFQGISLDNGMKFNLSIIGNEDSNLVLGAVIDIVKDSPADLAGVKRGMLFNKIDSITLERNNFSELLDRDSYSIGLAEIRNNTVFDTDDTIELNKIELTENPIAISKVLNIEDKKIGYIQYNQFVFGSEAELNDVFADFKSQSIDDLVLDFRYNGGGSIATAVDLSTMVTGQFEGEIFYRQQYNSELQRAFENGNPENLLIRFSDSFLNDNQIKINSLNLSKVYVITTKRRTASASELVINGLRPFIDVIIIGDETGTVGKTQGSRTFYDSENLDKENVNPNHKYALQPLIVEGANKNNETVSDDGFLPTISQRESLDNLGILGDENEPLLKLAIDNILGRVSTVAAKRIGYKIGKHIGSDDMNDPTYQRMYITP
ncbi:S41 family peptidase [Aquimarina agarivorans]|uniref:S41 family peptidase n=1 Tax=Aquimarina agarivorans TaxID=980584 RepID=UPI000248EA78|nr:S41 family peptidase [Aquimarina agarivorans]